MTTQEITKSSRGIIVVTWQWRNGWNIIDTRQPTPDEVQRFNAGDGHPILIKEDHNG